MTTPAGPTATTPVVTTDKANYAPGDPITVTVEYTDPANPGTTVTVTAIVTNSDGTTGTGTAQVTVGGAPANPLPVSVTAAFPGGATAASFTQTSNQAGTAVFSGTIGTPPASA